MKIIIGLLCLLSITFVVAQLDLRSTLSWDYDYEDCEYKEQPIYQYVNKLFPCTIDNKTCIKGRMIIRVKEIIGYEKVPYDCKRSGITIDSKKIIGSVNVKDNSLIQWSIPIGERNFAEFGDCRDFEERKGVCTNKKLIDIKNER